MKKSEKLPSLRMHRGWVRRWFWNPRRTPLLLLGILILAEVGLRLVLGLGNPVLYQADPDCGYLPQPSQNVRRFFCHNQINRFSMRSADVSEHKQTGMFRLMLVGDSVTDGTTYVDQALTFPGRLAEELSKQLNRKVEVLAASAGGWAVGNEIGYIRSRGVFDADLVLLVLNEGDLTQVFSRPELDSPSFPLHRPPLAIWELWTHYIKPRITHKKIEDPGSVVRQGVSVGAEILPVAQLLALVEEGRQRVSSSGARFGIVYSPVRPANGTWGRVDDERLLIIKQWAASQDVPFLDLTPAFEEHSSKDIYMDGIHLSAAGDAIVAQSIERFWPKFFEHVTIHGSATMATTKVSELYTPRMRRYIMLMIKSVPESIFKGIEL